MATREERPQYLHHGRGRSRYVEFVNPMPVPPVSYQIVLLDEKGAELERGPDTYDRNVSWIVLGEFGYTLVRTAEEDGQTVRYFQRGRLDD